MVIHVEEFGVFLGKTCRLCVGCEILIAHRDEIEQVLSASLGRAIDSQTFVVLGTMDRRVWRRGLGRPVSLDAVKKQMADFKANLRVDFTPAGWHSKENAGYLLLCGSRKWQSHFVELLTAALSPESAAANTMSGSNSRTSGPPSLIFRYRALP